MLISCPCCGENLEVIIRPVTGADIPPAPSTGVDISARLEGSKDKENLKYSQDGGHSPGKAEGGKPGASSPTDKALDGETDTPVLRQGPLPVKDVLDALGRMNEKLDDVLRDISPEESAAVKVIEALPIIGPAFEAGRAVSKWIDSRPHRKPSPTLARRRLWDAIFAVIKAKFEGPRLFVTLTFTGGSERQNTTPDEALAMMCRAWDRVNKRLRKIYERYEFVRIVGYHTDGMPHFHVVLFGGLVESLAFYRDLKEAWTEDEGCGYVNRRTSEDGHRPEALTEYIMQNIAKPGEKKRNSFSTSRGFFPPKMVARLVEDYL